MELTKKHILGAGAILLGGVIFFSCLGTNSSGYYQVKQAFVTGDMSVVRKAGVYPKCFGTMTKYQVSDTYYFGKSDLDGGDSAEAQPIGVRFGGGGTAYIDGSVKFRMPQGDDKALSLHKDYKNEHTVKADLIRQQVQTTLKATATLFRPEETYSGRRSEFISIFEDQLERGLYKTRSKQIVTTDADGNKLTETIVEVVKDKKGQPIIDKPSPFSDYGIQLVSVNIKDIDYSKEIDELIAAKQKSEQQKVVARAAAEKAKQDAITAAEEGKANVAKAKATADVQKQTAITAAEKEKAVATLAAEKERDVAKLNKEKAELEAKALLVKKRADAEANALLVKAGLTPLEKANIEKETAIGVARELSKVNVPTILVGGGNDGQSSPMDAVGLNMMLEVQEKMKKLAK